MESADDRAKDKEADERDLEAAVRELTEESDEEAARARLEAFKERHSADEQ